MKIDLQSAYNVYRKNQAAADALKAAEGTGTGSRKTDKVDIARGQTVMEEKELMGLKAGLQRSISYPADAQRLQELQDKVREGTYHISTEELTDAILSFIDD